MGQDTGNCEASPGPWLRELPRRFSTRKVNKDFFLEILTESATAGVLSLWQWIENTFSVKLGDPLSRIAAKCFNTVSFTSKCNID